MPELAISAEKVGFLIEKAREFDVKDVASDPDSGSNGADDDMIDVLEDSDRHTRCPKKGEASYYTIRVEDHVVEAGAWYYPNPIEGAPPNLALAIAGCRFAARCPTARAECRANGQTLRLVREREVRCEYAE